MQGLLELLAAPGILVLDLAQVLLFLPLQDAQEVVELGHAEGIPLQGEGRQALSRHGQANKPSPEETERPGPTWGFLTSAPA